MYTLSRLSMVIFVVSIIFLPNILTDVRADDLKAREIMEKVDARDDGDNQTADMEMVLIDKRGTKTWVKIRTG
ncbi:MAG: hypothetical protein JRI64_07850 [Deltaproteobacteria bacterium]|nr:hypothetical protein [Deltaproteobacteria bacterium]